MQDFGNVERAAHIQAKAADGVRGLRLGTPVERVRSGIQRRVFQSQKHRACVGGLAAPPVAETGVLPAIGAAPVIVATGASTARAATAAESAPASTASSAAKAAAWTLAAAWPAARTAAKTSVDAAGSKAAQA